MATQRRKAQSKETLHRMTKKETLTIKTTLEYPNGPAQS